MKLRMHITSCLFLSLLAINLDAQVSFIRAKIDSLTVEVSQERLREDIDGLVSFHTRHTFSDTLSPSRGIGAARRWLYHQFQLINAANNNRMNVYFDWFDQAIPRRWRPAAGADTLRLANVIAVIPGRTERTLIITGHYDSRTERGDDITSAAPGADDDGSGTAALLELARILAKERLENTVILAAVTGEEEGLFGSTYMAGKAVRLKLPIEGVIANDMIGNTHGGQGWSDNTVLRCFSPDPVDSPSRLWALYLGDIAAAYYPRLHVKQIFRLDRFGRGGDHSPFIKEGFAGVRFTEPWENYQIQHSPSDVPDTMSFEYLNRTTALNLALAWYWSMSPPSPLVTSIHRDDDYRTCLEFRWEGDPDDLAGFRILMRPTDRGYWDESILIEKPARVNSRFWGSVFHVSLENRDQDYCIFAVAAVDKNGFESIPAVYDRERLRSLSRR